MSIRATRLLFVVFTLVLSSSQATPQTRLKGRVKTPGNNPLVAHEVVVIEGAGKYDTNDYGEFEFDLAQGLKVGAPARFHVIHANPAIKIQEWVVIYPCDYVNGRMLSLPAGGSESIAIVVPARADQRLKSLNRDYSILPCTIEEVAAQFEPASRSLSDSRSSSQSSAVAKGGPYRPSYESPESQTTRFLRFVEATYHVNPEENSHGSFLVDAPESTLLGQAFLARKAAELGFTPEELDEALHAWARSVQDMYEKGLAALYERHYAEASQYISASIPSPPGEFLKRYVPLARAEYEQGHYRAAEAALRKVLAVHSEDPLILNNLALVLIEEAEYSDAEPLIKKALTIDEKALGPDHPDVGTILNLLGELCFDQLKYGEAEALFRRALAIHEKALGLDHPSVAIEVNNLAWLYHSQGRYLEAEPLYRRALAINEKALGPYHPEVATNLNNLAECYRVQGKYAEAEPLYKRALAIDEKALGPDHPQLATDLNNLGELYRGQGNYAEAEPLYKKALAIDEKALGPNHPTVGTILDNLAKVYDSQGKYAEAEPLIKRALAIDEKVLGPDHPDVAARLNTLGAVYYAQRRYAEAEPLYKRALAIDEKALGPDHPHLATELSNLAELYRVQSRYTEAEPLFKRALAIDEKVLGPDHTIVASRLSSLGAVYYAQRRYAEAEPLYRRALTIDERALGPYHPDVATIAKNLALALRELGRDAEAKAYEDQAARIRAKKQK